MENNAISNTHEFFPDEIWIQILDNLSSKELRLVALVSHYFNALSNDNGLWKNQTQRDYFFSSFYLKKLVELTHEITYKKIYKKLFISDVKWDREFASPDTNLYHLAKLGDHIGAPAVNTPACYLALSLLEDGTHNLSMLNIFSITQPILGSCAIPAPSAWSPQKIVVFAQEHGFSAYVNWSQHELSLHNKLSLITLEKKESKTIMNFKPIETKSDISFMQPELLNKEPAICLLNDTSKLSASIKSPIEDLKKPFERFDSKLVEKDLLYSDTPIILGSYRCYSFPEDGLMCLVNMETEQEVEIPYDSASFRNSQNCSLAWHDGLIALTTLRGDDLITEWYDSSLTLQYTESTLLDNSPSALQTVAVGEALFAICIFEENQEIMAFDLTKNLLLWKKTEDIVHVHDLSISCLSWV